MTGKRNSTIVDYRTLRPMISIPRSVVGRNTNGHPILNFTLLTYNILAQGHIKRESYPYCSKYTLRWSHRKETLATEISAYDADVVCFQEMDRFHNYFQPLLHKLGYNMVYYLRNGPDSDVNCVGWKRNKFKLIESKQVSFEGTTAGLGSVPNVAQLVALEVEDDPNVKLIIATTHLYWREDCDHIRFAQMHALIGEVIAFRDSLESDFVLIVAGDFNSDHDSMALQAVLRSNFLMDEVAFENMLEKLHLTSQVLRQILSDFTISWPRFYDAYEDYAAIVPGPNGYKLPYTTFCLYKGILDFILYCKYSKDGNLVITPAALRIIPDRQVLEEEVSLPNRTFASDHLALECQFTIFRSHSGKN